ncbi:trihelix transcription factor GTL2-like [Lotus japonicus]|uniref:trihelix transcription factor GTL2-like n=1 Tax=Lotus japonicus TaxID=34305 RepID=UPI002585810F|nr:trihelix transcription factor GTL2-like [Lotus japonicus]
MFDGVPDQFHQFITPRTSLPLHLPFPLHASSAPNNNTTFPSFDPYNPSHHQLPFQPNLLHHPLHHKDEEKEENNNTVQPNPMNFQIERDQRQQLPQLQQQQVDPWTNDEVLALLRIRSSMESWFPEFTWEHVSRKLAEVGYKRSAEKCKEKFEEETRYFNNINYTNKSTNINNYRFLTELEELYEEVGTEKSTTHQQQQQQQDKMEERAALDDQDHHDDSVDQTKQNKAQSEEDQEKIMKERKRKRVDDRFEVFKGFCESVVNNMMARQEEMHRKIIEDMVRRDEEKFSKEEAWKKQEMDKMNKELEMMAHEQAIAGDRQANIIQFLKNFEKSQRFGSGNGKEKLKVTSEDSSTLLSQNPSPSPSSTLPTSCALVVAENPSSINLGQDTSSRVVVPFENPSSSLNPQETNSVLIHKGSTIEKDDVGRRWPKDEVLALINLRCTSNNNEDKEGNNKAPLWERISQGMLELGYKRSAKRCKEKWENINKYFRKTKDNTSKKRSLDSRTCPYFHQLSNLYNQGKLVPQSERPEGKLNNAAANNNAPDQITPQAESSSTQVGSGCGNFTVQQQQQQKVDDHEGEKTSMQQVPSLDFDQF